MVPGAAADGQPRNRPQLWETEAAYAYSWRKGERLGRSVHEFRCIESGLFELSGDAWRLFVEVPGAQFIPSTPPVGRVGAKRPASYPLVSCVTCPRAAICHATDRHRSDSSLRVPSISSFQRTPSNFEELLVVLLFPPLSKR